MMELTDLIKAIVSELVDNPEDCLLYTSDAADE